MDGSAEDSSDSTQLAESDSEQRVYFVPYRWWKRAHDSMSGESNGKRGIAYAASPASSYGGPMKIINNIFSSDLAFNLRREENSARERENGEVGVSGRDFALVSGEMWVQALKWHSDSKVAVKESRSFSAAEDDMFDVYPLQLRLSVLREANSLAVRISKKDNAVELFKRACKIFSVDIELMRIWDFSGQTTLFFLNDNNRFSKDGSRMSDQEVLLELQIYGLSDSIKCKERKKDEKGLPYCNGTNSITINGSTCNGNSDSFRVSTSSAYQSSEAGSLGLTGLQNLGNTCFMNSSLQCLAHTPKLIDYFLGDYAREINHENPLGMDGEIALAFGDLIRKLWAPGACPVAPRMFKSKLARFAPQFSGCNQHDSQELLSFLLDGLHEDLNRVKCKPYVEAKDADGRPDEDVADEYWRYHLARNDSVIVDVCQGQYKSTLVCPVCKKVSVTFDPFMCVSLPLPSTTMRTMTLTVITTDGSTQLSPYTITVPKFGKCEDLIRALSAACSLGDDETLLLAEIYNNRIIRYLEEPTDSLTLIRDEDRLVAYRLAKDSEDLPLVVFMHERMEEQSIQGNSLGRWKSFGIPLVARLSGQADGSNLCSLYLRLLNLFRNLSQDAANENDCSESSGPEDATTAEDALSSIIGPGMSNNSDVKRVDSTSDSELTEDATTAEDALSSIIGPGMSNNSDVKRVDSTSDSELTEDATTAEDALSSIIGPGMSNNSDVKRVDSTSDSELTEDATTAEDALSSIIGPGMSNNSDVKRVDSTSDSELKLYLTDRKGITKDREIRMSEPVVLAEMSRQLNVLVSWPKNQIKKYDTSPLSSLPEIFKTGFFSKKAQGTVSLYKCLEAFLTEEPLGPDDMWYCPRCKEHRQASKKLDLWRLPEILVIHLKRFSYSRFLKKLETYVDFPIDNLDLSAYIACKNDQSSCRYMLYAVSNHYGSMGGGHYTAFVHHGGNRWYDFDDSHVCPISLEKIKTSAAYVLFYRRVIEV